MSDVATVAAKVQGRWAAGRAPAEAAGAASTEEPRVDVCLSIDESNYRFIDLAVLAMVRLFVRASVSLCFLSSLLWVCTVFYVRQEELVRSRPRASATCRWRYDASQARRVSHARMHTHALAHLPTCTPTRLHTYTPAHLHFYTTTHLRTCAPTEAQREHLHIWGERERERRRDRQTER